MYFKYRLYVYFLCFPPIPRTAHITRKMDRNEVQVQVACILVSLPLPPMPILVCRGEDSMDGVCSSHNLHTCMIATDMQRTERGAVTQDEQTKRMLRKACALNQMQTEMQAALCDPSLLHDGPTLHKCYDILGRALRQYFGVYAHECTDVRICPLDSVVTRDGVHTHMLAYVNANLALQPPGPDKNTSYTDLLKLWLKENFVSGDSV